MDVPTQVDTQVDICISGTLYTMTHLSIFCFYLDGNIGTFCITR